ncbi:hypothetical protein [Microbulbifer sp. TYP-18]|uniref:hypothetical protein n=1 Tax=Microbulbifer sp. TYP-18 TaxID=3230024 RepID=UPI0034C61DB9
MTDKQFKFSLIVGGMLVTLGAILTMEASIGVSLVGLGLVIATLAVLARNAGQHGERQRLLLLPIAIEEQQKSESTSKGR